MIITALTQQKYRPGRISVFIDGAFAFGMEQSDAERCGLSEGLALTRERLDHLLNEVIFTRARDTALRYLSCRPRTLRETFNRLKDEDYPGAVIKRVLVLMVKLRYINDRQYAKDYIDSRARAHYGLFRIKQELAARGVKPEVISRAVSQTEFDEPNFILEFIRRNGRDFNKDKFNADKLRRRGFSNSGIREALKAFREEQM